MSLAIGIVGLPNVGKSTLFNALTDAGIVAANYPFATIEPNVGIVPIPDPRLDELAEIFGSQRVAPATVTFVDIAGLVRGASRGEGLGNRFLARIREVDAICHVVRAFQTANVVHVEDTVDPKRDIETLETELALADLEAIDRRLPRMEKEATVDRSQQGLVESLSRVRKVVASGEMINAHPELTGDLARLAELQLLTAKPVVYVFNCDEQVLTDEVRREELTTMVAPSQAVFLDAQMEAELLGLGPEDRRELLRSIGQQEPGLHLLIRAAFSALGLQTFLTAGPKEARAWTIRRGTTAQEAAGEIHSDFSRGFIAAEVVDFRSLVEAGSWQEARRRGLIRTEGRSYVMSEDDVVEFRFNV